MLIFLRSVSIVIFFLTAAEAERRKRVGKKCPNMHYGDHLSVLFIYLLLCCFFFSFCFLCIGVGRFRIWGEQGLE